MGKASFIRRNRKVGKKTWGKIEWEGKTEQRIRELRGDKERIQKISFITVTLYMCI